MGDFFVVLLQEIGTKIIFCISPHCVDMVGVVLRVIVLKDERRALDAVIVRLLGLNETGPREVDLLKTSLFNFLAIGFAEFGAKVIEITIDQLGQHLLLCFGHFACRDPQWF